MKEYLHFICRPMLTSFLFDCFVKIWATCEKFWANGSQPPPPPPRQKIARMPMNAIAKIAFLTARIIAHSRSNLHRCFDADDVSFIIVY